MQCSAIAFSDNREQKVGCMGKIDDAIFMPILRSISIASLTSLASKKARKLWLDNLRFMNFAPELSLHEGGVIWSLYKRATCYLWEL